MRQIKKRCLIAYGAERNSYDKNKICGLRRQCDIDYVNLYKPDYVGFILSKPFRRYIAPENAAQLISQLNGKITSVGVFVDEPIEYVVAAAKAAKIGIIQLHGSEDDVYIKSIKEAVNLPIIKAFKVQSEYDIAAAKVSTADYVLLDSGTGTGVSFDWSLISDIGREFFLAGGINSDNAASAIEKHHPYVLDISSGVETDGVKDKAKIETLIAAVRIRQQ